MTIKSLRIEDSADFLVYVTHNFECYFFIEKTGECEPASLPMIEKEMKGNRWGVRSKYHVICIKDSKILTTFHKYQDDDRIILNSPSDDIIEKFSLEDASWYV